ncbi:hypothetical protein IC235_10170 [Hymenobacter sp. BT664]|uniref:Uncharacterized protein n=1 Tax=Hymenobacter montanus TaxID=2771359 RepID=A0A927BDW6_9BACT|nr:hypothetical protein [Hymenobacter montanus]
MKTLCNRPDCSSLTTTPDLLNLDGGRPGTLLIISTTSGKKILIDVVDEEAGNRIRNAVFHLVTLAKANKAYKSKDPFDY